jgi:hypothetical protein
MRHRHLIANIVGAFLLSSCAAVQEGDAVVKYEKNGSARMTKAPSNGTYSLYSSTDLQTKVSHYLDKGQDVGFRKESDGRLVAIAGTADPIPLEEGGYYWRLR